MSTVLVVDDDAAVRELVTTTFELEGYAVAAAESLPDAQRQLAIIKPDLIVLDLILRGGSGFELLDELRQSPASDTVAVMILSAVEAPHTKLRAFRLGADDYVAKPFMPEELLARAGAILRRTGHAANRADVIDIGDLTIDLSSRDVLLNGELIDMTAKEFDLLAFLAQHRGRVFTRHQLLRSVWNSSSDWQQQSTVTEHVRRLRAKLGDHWIQTARGVGYRFERQPAGPTVDLRDSRVPAPRRGFAGVP